MVKFDIVTFGSAVVDTFIDAEFNKKTNSFNYKTGSKILIQNLKSDIGGGATNTATAFSRFGFKTGCICKIGDDNNGKNILSSLKRENIKFLGSIVKEKTGNSIILDSKNNGRVILTFKGPGNSISTSELPKFKTKWLYYSSVLKTSLQTQIKLAQKAKLKETKIAFNPSSYLVKNKNILPLLKLTDVLILNKEEAQELCKINKTKGNINNTLLSLGPKIIVITDKNNPAYAYDGIKKYFIKPHNIKVVERTGAGDAFASGFVAGLMVNLPMQKCLELALKEGESVLQHFGAKNNLIRKNLKQ